MESPSLIITSYQDALSRSMDIVANNVANMNTTGFKREDVKFSTYLSSAITNADARANPLDFVIDRATFRDMSAGSFAQTGNELDFAIQGPGFFQIQTKEGLRFTRAGSFQVNNEGDIVTPDGNKLLGDGGQAISVSSEIGSIYVSGDGVISGKSTSADGAIIQVGKISVVNFKNDQELQAVGNNLYTTTQTPEPVINASIVQGSVEKSNVDPVAEMTRMVTILRSYQQAAKILDVETQRLTNAISKLARATA